MSIVDLFLQHAEAYPDKPAIQVGDQQLTYADLACKAGQLADLLRRLGVQRGDCVLLGLENGLAFSLCTLATADLGVMIAPVSGNLPEPALNRSLEVTGAKFLIADRRVCRRLIHRQGLVRVVVGQPLRECHHFETAFGMSPEIPLGQGEGRGDDAFLLTMTSGSTGNPKPITLTQNGKIRRSLDGARDLYNLDVDDVIITSTPMYHSLGFRLALLPLLIGATSVILAHFTTAAWIAAVRQHAVTFAIMVSSHLESIAQQLDEEKTVLPSLRTLVSSSALLATDVKRQCIAVFDCDFHECYGASEVGIVTNLAPEDCRDNLSSVGKALDYVDLRIVDENREQVPHGAIGEIACSTSTLFRGYYQQTDATAQSLNEGYFLTGDMGFVDDEGYLTLAGRKKDIIIIGGSNVYPEDVEAVLKEASGVKECAVIGVPDAHFGEAALALVVADGEGVDLRKLRLYCAERLADFQQPQAYEQVDRLPRTAMGKIQRQVLRDRYAEYDATADLRRMMRRR